MWNCSVKRLQKRRHFFSLVSFHQSNSLLLAEESMSSSQIIHSIINLSHSSLTTQALVQWERRRQLGNTRTWMHTHILQNFRPPLNYHRHFDQNHKKDRIPPPSGLSWCDRSRMTVGRAKPHTLLMIAVYSATCEKPFSNIKA